jgi:hypothetical protein
MKRSLVLDRCLCSHCQGRNSRNWAKSSFRRPGSPEAQAHFLRGLAALHSFWYEEALEAFRESTKDRA